MTSLLCRDGIKFLFKTKKHFLLNLDKTLKHFKVTAYHQCTMEYTVDTCTSDTCGVAASVAATLPVGPNVGKYCHTKFTMNS